MKIDKSNAPQIIIGLLSCSLLVGAVTTAWKINRGICILLFIYLALLLFYLFHSWRYKQWNEPAVNDPEQRRRALQFRSTLKTVHSIFLVMLITVPVICLALLLLQNVLPEYTNDLVVQSFGKQEYKKVLDSKSISFETPDQSRVTPHISFVASVNSNRGVAYPTTPFFSLLLQTLIDPIWGLAWSALVWVIVIFIAVWFAEFIGGTTFHFK